MIAAYLSSQIGNKKRLNKIKQKELEKKLTQQALNDDDQSESGSAILSNKKCKLIF